MLFKNLRQFKIAREQIEAIYDEHFSGAVREIRWRGADLGDDRRQCALNGAPAKTLDELYAVAEKASLAYGEVMTAACPDGAVLKLAPLKGRARAAAKARNEYAKNTAPATSWLAKPARAPRRPASLCGIQLLVWVVLTKLQTSRARSNRSRFG